MRASKNYYEIQGIRDCTRCARQAFYRPIIGRDGLLVFEPFWIRD